MNQLDAIKQLEAAVANLAAADHAAWEMHSDTVAQHDSEVALYGDSWPGAAADIEHGRAALSELSIELASVQTRLETEHPIHTVHIPIIETEEPF